jgi:serine/threonine-protein kinase
VHLFASRPLLHENTVVTPEKYKQVKDIFLAAADKPRDEQAAYVEKAANGDPEIRREVESLLNEHRRDTQVIPSEPESPLGNMSALLSRAQLEEQAAVDHAAPRNQAQHADDDVQKQPTEFMDDSHSSSSTGSGIIDSGRFMAGTMVAGRYRIIELLGRGGMGEVYRADDITLNQSVALKFLPTLFGSDQKWLERFRNEVRLARQVTHPNVCRVFDIGEFQGDQFISMEYVDGEDLASLLRRIGRVPHDKALQIARQLCAGLAAAHDRGVLHRDLKPANVMIDGRGAVRITDFGLAAPADQLRKDAIRAGTPAYMSPEQLAGKGVTVRSDIYSLGLLLYEMFTGRRAFKGETLRDYQKLHTTEDPTAPSQIVEDIDPIVERVILKCLEKDPKNRPARAMAVSAALPGGNPLREILAAGDTPSPEVVAAAGQTEGTLPSRRAAGYLIMAILSLILIILLSPKAYLVQSAIQEKSPDVLIDKANTLIHDKLGYPKPVDKAFGFSLNASYYLHVEQTDPSPHRWQKFLQPTPGLVYFWYRESQQLLVPLQPGTSIQENDPPPIRPGNIRVTLNASGHLINFEARPTQSSIPPRYRNPTSQSQPATATAPAIEPLTIPAENRDFPEWSRPLLEAANLDPKSLTPATPHRLPPVYADSRAAWDIQIGGEQMRIEAAALHNKPVYFSILGDWKEQHTTSRRDQRAILAGVNDYIQTLMNGILVIAGSFLAWRNYRSGRGDRGGALRMAIAFFAFGFVAWLLRAEHVPDLMNEFALFRGAAGAILYRVCVIWIFYLALEPYVRRIWPETVISWSRLLSGKWFDPLVGRDILIGAAVGTLTMVLQCMDMLVPRWLGYPAPLPSDSIVRRMLSSLTSSSNLFSGASAALYLSLILLLVLVLLRITLRRKVAVYFAFIAIYIAASPLLNTNNYVSYIIQAFTGLMFLTLLIRHGLVALVFCILVRNCMMEFPVTADLSTWYAPHALIGPASVVILLGLSFYAALGGRSPITLRPLDT